MHHSSFFKAVIVIEKLNEEANLILLNLFEKGFDEYDIAKILHGADEILIKNTNYYGKTERLFRTANKIFDISQLILIVCLIAIAVWR